MDQSAKALMAVENWTDRLRVQRTQQSAGTAEALENQRWARRRKSDLPGLICSPALQSQLKCRMRDGSSSGALLLLETASEKLTVDDVPDSFTLFLMNPTGYTQVQCTVIRRYGDCLGVKYCGAFRTVVKERAPAKSPAGRRR